ncbi:MAG: MBL fold metallo-hydrolase, partial [Treponema sp.]|nr:MBL fold metallo-hydrolase [Treponema sp.]
MDKPVRLAAPGGSGENGRNCFAVEYGEDVFLLDCGVQRDIRNGQVGFYPNLTRDFIARIKAVFLSHCHEDHSAALPLLYEMGYRGKVYASSETAARTPAFISKWIDFVMRNHGTLPFAPERAANIQFETLPLGNSSAAGIQLCTGRSGHVLGGIWFHFRFGNKKIAYSGDMVTDPFLLAWDPVPESDAAILNCAHAGQKINSGEQFAALNKSIGETLSRGGMLLLPLPPAGRGSDLYAYLSTHAAGLPLFVEQNIIDNYQELTGKTGWIKPGGPVQPKTRVVPVANQTQRETALASGTGIYLAGDGMLSTADSQCCFELLKGKKENKIIITGHAAEGTIAAGILNPVFRVEQGVSCETEKIIFKAHL